MIWNQGALKIMNSSNVTMQKHSMEPHNVRLNVVKSEKEHLKLNRHNTINIDGGHCLQQNMLIHHRYYYRELGINIACF